MADGPKLTALGKIVIFLFIAGCFYGAYFIFFQNRPAPGSPQPESTTPVPQRTNSSGARVEIGIAYGTEKREWLEWAAQEFSRAEAGRAIQLNLLPMGSLDSGKAIANGDQRIHVWLPASSVYKDIFVQDWQVNHGMNQNPIAREELLALSPMVLVMWDERYQAFKQKYPELSFNTLSLALAEQGGWAAIANKPEWGLFKFGHTHPNESNSGLITLLLMAYDYKNKCRDLQVADIVDTGFQNWLQAFERGISGLSNSTGNMMREMVLKGPSTYDGLFVYENVAIDYLKNAEGRWGTLHVVYPKQNMWNDNPYYILDTPWVSAEQRQAATAFLDFLLSEPVQTRSLQHGFRPGNPNVPIKFPESPFVKYQQYGLQIDVAQTCEPPKAEVITNLLGSWQRARGGR